MLNNNEVSKKEKSTGHPVWQFIRKNGISMLMAIIMVFMLASPDAKSFVLRQVMRTGLFNASIDKKNPTSPDLSPIDFNFEDEKGTVLNTSSLRGQVVFINFWASWCPPCRAEFPSIEALYSRFRNNPDIFFLMLNNDDAIATARNYLKTENYSIPFYKMNGNVSSAIYTGTLPTTIVLDKRGEVRFHHESFANYGTEKFIKQLETLIRE